FGHRALEIGIGDPYVAGGVDRQSPRETSGLAAGHRRSLGHRAPTADRGGDRVVASGDPDGARRVDGQVVEATHQIGGGDGSSRNLEYLRAGGEPDGPAGM